MLRAVRLDNQLEFSAVEVYDVPTDRMLPAELVVAEPSVPQPSPEAPLGPRVLATHPARVLENIRIGELH
jgi:hypothetical protein